MADFLDISEAANFLKVSKHLLYRLTSREAVPHHHIGARVVFDRAELEQWVRNGTSEHFHAA